MYFSPVFRTASTIFAQSARVYAAVCSHITCRPLARGDVKAIIRPDKQWFIQPNRKRVDELAGLLGEENIRLWPKPMEQKERRGAWQGRYSGAPKGQNGVASAAVTRFD